MLKKVTFRDLCPSDWEKIITFHSTLSDDTLYRRWFGVKRYMSAEEAKHLANVSYDSREAVGAFVDDALVGVARYTPLSDFSTGAEFAIVLTDAWQNQGVGKRLMRELLRRAARNGIAKVHAETLTENRAVRLLNLSVGLILTSREQYGSEVIEEYDIPDEYLPVMEVELPLAS